MGASSSAPTAQRSPNATTWPKDGLKPPEHKNGLWIFHVVPQDEEIRKKAPSVLLEIGPGGFRFLRPDNEDPLIAFTWGQIHSWSTGDKLFFFRAFEERASELVSYSVALNEADMLFQEIHSIIRRILDKKRESAIHEHDFESMLNNLVACQGGERISILRDALESSFFTSLQGQRVVQSMDNSFDKVEAALLLHSKLIDVCHFQMVLDALECQEDRDNVWHRISAIRKCNSNPLMVAFDPSQNDNKTILDP